MRRPRALVAAALAMAAATAAAGTVRHELAVRLDPASGRLEAVDRVVLGDAIAVDAGGGYRFVLHAGLSPEVRTPGWRLEAVSGPVAATFLGLNATTETAADVPLEGWRLVPVEAAVEPVELAWAGELRHELATSGEEYQRSFSESPGLIGPEGVFLAGTSFWLPTFGDGLVTFTLEVAGLEPPWDVVSQGERVRHELAADGTRTTGWRLDRPTEEVYLVAGPWTEYAATAGDVALYAFLREPDPALAARYLDATKRYLALYEGMLEPYPYRSFALVENFWETGYGMPGFTLLGPRIIRFPWILTSSYPHEILHNWWGNAVLVDYPQGNWCEGLTAYLADHLFAEQRGEGADHRRATLQKYTDFVSAGADFPLAEFGSRHSAASEAVGYGKSLMVFHMLRRAVGDEGFLAALRRFDREHRFSRASWADLAAAFEAETGGQWREFVAAWTGRTGAPRLEVRAVAAVPSDGGDQPWTLRLDLAQVQAEDPFPMTVPVAVTLAGRSEAMLVEVGNCGGSRDCSIRVPCPAQPLRVDVDPAFDVMRRLDPLEVPPALSTVFGAEAPLFVLPASAGDRELAAWRELAAGWARPGEPRTALDRDLEALPAGSVWVLGAANRFAAEVAGRLAEQGVSLTAARLVLPGRELPAAGHSLVLVARGAHDPADSVGLVTADPPAAVPGLARKLPHYTRYSYLAFAGDEPENVAKGGWRPLGSPLVRQLGDEPVDLVMPVRPPLAELPPVFDAERLRATVAVLADPALEGRGLGSAGLARATDWVEERMREIGLEPTRLGGYRQSFSWTGGEPEREMELVNLVGRIPGSDPKLADRPVLVLAHLDHLGRGWPDVRAGNEGQVHAGADDNASGVAVLLEVARALAAEPPRPRPVELAVVTGEEAGLVGSRRLLEAMTAVGRTPSACVNLDTVGRLEGRKLLVLDAATAREWRFLFMGVGHTTGAPLEVVSEPLDSSDQVACIERGVPAVQLFTGPTADYHRPSDTVDTVDAAGMATVAEATREAVAYLAERPEPLTVTIGDPAPPAATHPGGVGERRASLGTMPDFAFPGPGVRVEQVTPGSAAEAAGVLAGDVLVAIDGEPIGDLRSYSARLKAHAPGDRVRLSLRRDGRPVDVEAVLGER